MSEKKRMHPMMIVVEAGTYLKSMFFLFLILFVFQYANESLWARLGRWALLFITVIMLLYVLLKWAATSYDLKETGIDFYEGIFNKKQRHIAYRQVQHVEQQKPIYLNLFKLVSLKLETGAEGEEASLLFLALSLEEADRIKNTLVKEEHQQAEVLSEPAASGDTRTIHFASSRRDIWKASLLSFSYIALIPAAGGLFSNLSKFVDLKSMENSLIEFLAEYKLFLFIAVMLLLILLGVSGWLFAYLKYGKYVISSDKERVYVKGGVLNESQFAIQKKHVQAVAIKQSLFKRWLRIAEVELISAGKLDLEMTDKSSLYPFLPVQRAIEIVNEMLPEYSIMPNMKRLPARSGWARLFRIPWLWLAGLAALLIWKPEWWLFSFILLFLTACSRLLDYRNSGFLIQENQIQLQSGGFESTLFITNKRRIIEMKLKQSVMKANVGLSSVTLTNRGKPIHLETLRDVPEAWAKQTYQWYNGKQ